MLRVIAMATMLTDHIGWHFLDTPMFLTWLGRICLPLVRLFAGRGLPHRP